MTETAVEPKPRVTMDEITALAKRRGFIFQSSEIYGGIGGFFDYGPLGAILKRNVKDAWWRDTVELRDDVVGFDSSIIMHPQTWVASGHVDAFHDKLVDCKVCKHRFRADHLPSLDKCPDCGMKGTLDRAAQLQPDDADVGRPDGRLRRRGLSAAGNRSGHLRQLQEHLSERAQAARRSASRRSASRFATRSRRATSPFACASSNRPSSSISCPTTATTWQVYESGSSARKDWYSDYGVAPTACASTSSRRPRRPHYAKAGTDVEYLFPWGWGELESIAHRGTYDLDAHMKLSGKDLRFFDEATKTHYTPILIESSAGMDRTTLTLLIDAYERETTSIRSGKETKRIVLRFHPHDRAGAGRGLFARAQQARTRRARPRDRGALRPFFRTQYDEGNIGQLYRRQDEIGTPFCIMVDYEPWPTARSPCATATR